jgi:hypothetical protein
VIRKENQIKDKQRNKVVKKETKTEIQSMTTTKEVPKINSSGI